MKKQTSFIATIIGFSCIIALISCEKAELTRSTETYNQTSMPEDSINAEDNSGIILELESDTLEEQIEDLYFQAQEWQEEELNTDL